MSAITCAAVAPRPKFFQIQVRGDINHIVFDVANQSATASERACVERMVLYAFEDAPVTASVRDDRKMVKEGIRWWVKTARQGSCLGGLPRGYGDSGAGRVLVSPKQLRRGSSYGVAIRLKGDVPGSARFQVMPNGSLRPISLEEAMRGFHPL